LQSSSGHFVGVDSASEKGSRRSSYSSGHTVESTFSVWTETGDLAEQLADVEEPLQNRLRKSLDCETASPEGSRAGLKRQRRVRYIAQSPAGRTDLEKISIDIPSPAPRRISRIERYLAIIMSPSNRHAAQIHGLVGKPLL
jgi:hypothetical protein